MVNFCWNCGEAVKPGHKFCEKCGTDLQSLPTVGQSAAPVASEPQKKPRVNFICLLLLIASIALWFYAPLAALNSADRGAPPSGWMLVTEDRYTHEMLTKSPVFWLEALPLVMMTLGVISLLFKDQKTVLYYIVASEFCLAGIAVRAFFQTEGRMDAFLTHFGWGFWVLAGLLLIAALTANVTEKK